MGLEGHGPLWRAKNHPVNDFLVPRAGGGTAPVPPKSPITRSISGWTALHAKILVFDQDFLIPLPSQLADAAPAVRNVSLPGFRGLYKQALEKEALSQP